MPNREGIQMDTTAWRWLASVVAMNRVEKAVYSGLRDTYEVSRILSSRGMLNVGP